jgi:uncharacterized membrane protein YeaQ/YmgE (transglycosylase-associated protein family)
MSETAAETLGYLQQNVLWSLVLAFVVGFLASKTVSHWERSNIVLYFVIGILGSFVGQFGVRYTGVQDILNQVSNMALLFDFVIAYLGSFVVATFFHFFKPM